VKANGMEMISEQSILMKISTLQLSKHKISLKKACSDLHDDKSNAPAGSGENEEIRFMIAQGGTYDDTITCWVDKF